MSETKPVNKPAPPKVVWTFHGSALVRDYNAAVKQLGRLIGLRPIEYSDSDAPLIARRGGMTWIADNSIELVQPTVPTGGWLNTADGMTSWSTGVGVPPNSVLATAAPSRIATGVRA